MTDRDPWNHVPWDPEPDHVSRIFWGGAAFFLVLAILFALGEVLGWWNLLGELGITISTLASLLLASLGLLWSATRHQATGIREAVLENGVKLGKLEKLDKLDVIERALVTEDGRASKLDVLQVELDRQTGVLDRQVGILAQIRDRL